MNVPHKPRCLQGLSPWELSRLPKLTAEAVDAALAEGRADRLREEAATGAPASSRARFQ